MVPGASRYISAGGFRLPLTHLLSGAPECPPPGDHTASEAYALWAPLIRDTYICARIFTRKIRNPIRTFTLYSFYGNCQIQVSC